MDKKRKQDERKEFEKKEFFRKQKEKMKLDFEEKVKLRKEVEIAQKQFEEEEKEKGEVIKHNVETYISQHKEEQLKEKQWRDEIAAFGSQNKKIFDDYDSGLKKYFRFYSLLDSKGINQELETSNMTINLPEFMKFGFQTELVPTVIS